MNKSRDTPFTFSSHQISHSNHISLTLLSNCRSFKVFSFHTKFVLQNARKGDFLELSINRKKAMQSNYANTLLQYDLWMCSKFMSRRKRRRQKRAIAIESLNVQSIAFYMWQVQKANLNEEIEHARKQFILVRFCARLKVNLIARNEWI